MQLPLGQYRMYQVRHPVDNANKPATLRMSVNGRDASNGDNGMSSDDARVPLAGGGPSEEREVGV